MPVRKIPKNYRNVTGILSSVKAKGKAAYESTLERDFLIVLEFLPEVVSYEVQPILINWLDRENKARKYTPDVSVEYKNGAVVIFEVKYRSELQENWPQLRPKFQAAFKFCRLNGWRFKLITEQQIRIPIFDNIKFLLPYQRINSTDADFISRQLLITAQLEVDSPITVDNILSQVTQKSLWDRASLLSVVWYLIATGQVVADLNEPLTMQTCLWKEKS